MIRQTLCFLLFAHIRPTLYGGITPLSVRNGMFGSREQSLLSRLYNIIASPQAASRVLDRGIVGDHTDDDGEADRPALGGNVALELS